MKGQVTETCSEAFVGVFGNSGVHSENSQFLGGKQDPPGPSIKKATGRILLCDKAQALRQRNNRQKCKGERPCLRNVWCVRGSSFNETRHMAHMLLSVYLRKKIEIDAKCTRPYS
jgi:hypothetical protein